MGLLVKGRRVGWQCRNPQGKWPPGPRMCEALLDQAPKPKPSAPTPVPYSRPERNTEPLGRPCLAGAPCGHHLASGETQCKAPGKRGEAGRHCGLLLLNKSSADPPWWSSPPQSPFRTSRQALLGTISSEAISSGHSSFSQIRYPLLYQEDSLHLPHPASCPLPLDPQERCSGAGARVMPRSAPLHHCHPWPLGYSSHNHCYRCFPPPPPSIILITAITKLFRLPAFFEFLHSVLTVTLLNGCYYDPHLGV